MPRIPGGKILLEPYSLGINTIEEMIRKLRDRGYEEIELTIRHGYGVVEINKYYVQVAIAPLTIILDEKIDAIGARQYRLVRDIWIDTVRISTDTLLEAIRLVSETSYGELMGYRINVLSDNTEYEDIVVLDYITVPVYWVIGRRSFMDEKYVKALSYYQRNYPEKIVFGVLVRNGDVKPYIVLEKRDDSLVVEALRTDKPRNHELLFWHLVDLLVSKPSINTRLDPSSYAS
jgi:hypothetical protein